VEVAVEVDARGRPCPLPVIDLAKAIAGVEPGEAVAILADDPAAEADVPAWCRMRGHEMDAVEHGDDHARYVVVRRL
jgi:tRNA 2-thiouridine synthesizing protein A